MKKYACIVCSNAATDYIETPYNIPVFRSVVIFGDEQYDDYTEIKSKDFYDRLENDKNAFPKTAFVSMGKMVEEFNTLKEKGFDGALVICISSALSGLQRAVTLASSEVENFEVHVYDSKTLGYPEAYMALEAARMFDEGKSLEDVLKRLDFIRDHNHIIFAVDTLEYLIKNGRLSKFVGSIAQMLKIRPVLEINSDGAVNQIEKTRTSKKARELVVDMFLKEIEGKDVTVFICNTNNDAAVEEFKSRVLEARPDLKEIHVYPLTPVVGAHAGPGALGIGWILNQ